MFWDKKDEENAEDTSLGVRSSTTAKTGTFFRTTSFHPAEFDQAENGSEKITLWREAVENPVTNHWTVFQMTCRPNTETAGMSNGVDNDDFVVHREILSGCDDLDLDFALENLLKYEQTQSKMGYIAADDKPEDYGATHVYQFALNEGKAPDVNGNIHPCHNGMVMAAGTFSRDVFSGVREAFNNPVIPPKPKTPVVGFEMLFSGDEKATDISRFIQKAISRNDWLTMTGPMVDVANAFIRMQYRGKVFLTPYRNEWYNNNKFVMGNQYEPKNSQVVETCFDKEDINWSRIKKWDKENPHPSRPRIHHEYFFMPVLAKAREAVAEIEEPERLDIKNFFTRYLDMMELAVEIACAKQMVSSLDEESQDPVAKEHAEKHVKYTLDRFRDLGASDDDIRSLNAEIIKQDKPFLIRDKYKERNLSLYSERYGLDLGSDNPEKERGCLLYYPEAIFGFLDACEEVTLRLNEKIDAERERIAFEKDDLASAFTKPADGKDSDMRIERADVRPPHQDTTTPVRTP